MAEISLNPVDRVEILSVMDNSVDVLMAGTPIAKRAPLLRDKFSRPQLRVEHEAAILMTVYDEGRKDSQLVRYYGAYSNVSRGKRKKAEHKKDVIGKPEFVEVPPLPISKELKRRWSHFIQKVYETDPLICPKCRGER